MTDMERAPAGASSQVEVRPTRLVLLAVPAAGAALCLAFLHRALFGGAVFASRDMLRVCWPLRAFWRERLLAGSWPGWFPGEALGESFTGLPIASAFHPLGALALLMDVGRALTWMNLLSFPAALAGAFVLCRALGATRTASLLGATGYAFGGYLVGVTATQPYLLSAAALPWAFWTALGLRRTPTRGWMLAAVLAAVCILLGGDLQAYLLGVGGMAGVVLMGPGWRRRTVLAGTFGFLAIAAGAVQWLPSALTSSGSAHVARASLDWAERLSLHPLQLLDTVWGPVFRGRFEDDASVFLAEQVLRTGASSLWVPSTYVGPVVVGLAVLGAVRARARWILLALGAVLLLALGRYGVLYGVLYRWLPGWSAFRYPMKVLPFALVILACLAASGLDALGREPGDSRRLSRGWLVVALASVLVVLVERATGAPGSALLSLAGAPAPDAAAERISEALVSTGAREAVVCLLAAVLARFGRGARWMPPLMVLVVSLDLFAANEPTYDVVPRGSIAMPPSAAAILASAPVDPLRRPRVSTAVEQLTLVGPKDDPSVRLVRARVMALENASQWLWGVETADAYLPLAPWWVWRMEQDRLWWVQTGHRLFSVPDMLASDAIATAMGPLAPPVVARWPEHGLQLLHQDVLPRAYLARRSCVGDELAAWDHLHSPGFAVGHEAVAVCSSAPGSGEVTGTVVATRWEPDLLQLEVEGGGGELVVNEAFARGWAATMDGAAVGIERVNLAVRGVVVPAGRHTVVLTYRTPGLEAGAIVSALVLGGLIAAAFARRRR